MVITVVTVTYGDRARFVASVVERVLEPSLSLYVRDVVVVDNASAAETKQWLRDRANTDGRLKVVELESNQGSAGGFAAGLRRAVEEEAEYLLLLDDDNIPCEAAIARLEELLNGLEASNRRQDCAILCTRVDHPYHRRLATGEPSEKVFPRKSSYCGFHLRDLPRYIQTRLSSPPEGHSVEFIDRPVAVPYGPYGGLFLRRKHVEQVGLPNTAYFVYSDDFDYTRRLVSFGVGLYLVPTCHIKDIDETWSNDGQRSTTRSLVLNASDARVFLTLRNQVYFEKSLSKNRLVYSLNRLAFVALLIMAAFRFAKWRRLGLMLSAIYRGEKGQLGRPDWILL